jgi:membrane protease subunit HflC
MSPRRRPTPTRPSFAQRPAAPSVSFQIGLALVLALLAGLTFDSLYALSADQEAVVVRVGQPIAALNTPETADPGLKFKLPLFDQVIRFDRRTQDVAGDPIEAVTADGRPIIVDAFVLYRILRPLQTFQAAGDAKAGSYRLAQMLNDAVRQVVGRTSYASLVTGDPSALMRQARAAVSVDARTAGLGVEIVDVGLNQVDPTPAQAQGLIHRMQAATTAQAAEIRAAGAQQKQIMMAQADKDAAAIRADAIAQSEAIWGEGDAGRADIFAKAYGKDPDFAHFYQAMRAYEAALGDKNTTLVLSPSSAFFQLFQKGPAGGG